MSARALQRVVVRMLYDAGFVRDVYRDADAALAGVPLTAVERGWLLAEDRRAWSIDPLRRARGLEALLEEYPAATAPWIAARGVPQLDAFFSSSHFHGAIQRRGSVAVAFGGYLVELAGARAARRALAELEAALAALRRRSAHLPWPPGAELRLAPSARPVALPRGTIEGYQEIRVALAALSGSALEALMTPGLQVPAIGVDVAHLEHALAERTPAGEAALGFVPEPLHRLLAAAQGGVTEAELIAIVVAEGGAEADGVELVEELVGDGLLERPPH